MLFELRSHAALPLFRETRSQYVSFPKGAAARGKLVDWEGRCPLCGGALTLRTARYGSNAGNDFWGCVRFPVCQGSLNFDGSLRDRSAKKKHTENGSTRQAAAQTASVATSARADGKGTSLHRGDLLISDNNSLGPGKLVAKDGEDLVLEYFDTPGQAASDRTRMSVSRRGLRRFTLKSETRVFWLSGAKWRSGRVIETTSHGDIYVRARDWEG